MPFSFFLGQMILSLILGGVTGWQREHVGKKAGIRTHALVAFAATLFTLVSLYGFPGADTARIAAQVLVGIGFIGAGTILHKEGGIEGLTTAAGLWAVTAVGMMVGVGWFLPAVAATVLICVVLFADDHRLANIDDKR